MLPLCIHRKRRGAEEQDEDGNATPYFEKGKTAGGCDYHDATKTEMAPMVTIVAGASILAITVLVSITRLPDFEDGRKIVQGHRRC